MDYNDKIAVGLLIIALVVTGAGYYLMRQDIEVDLGQREPATFRFRLAENVVIGWSRGEMVWRINVATILDPETDTRRTSRTMGEQVILQDISEGWFYRQGNLFFTFTVKEAHYDARTEDLELFTFRMDTPGGDWMETEKMNYEKKGNILHAPGPVKGYIGGADFTAGNMTIFLDTEEVILGGGVAMEYDWEGW